MVVKINIFYIQHFHLDDNAPYLSSKFCITIVSNFSWVLQSSQEKDLGGNKVYYDAIIGDVQMTNVILT